MSWFDTASIANIAKTALKEAQKTIDKALDIRDDDLHLVPANTPVDTNSDDFFSSWGITSTAAAKQSNADPITKSPTKPSRGTTSIWGSFTGSFFDASLENEPKELLESLDDSIDIYNDFKESKLVVQDSEDSDGHQKMPDTDRLIIDNEISPKAPHNIAVSFGKKTSEEGIKCNLFMTFR